MPIQDSEAKKWMPTSAKTGKGIGGAVAGAAGATAVGAGVAHARGDTNNNSHLSQQQQHGPSSSGDTAAQNDVAQQDQPPRRRSLQEYISGMIDTRRGSFKVNVKMKKRHDSCTDTCIYYRKPWAGCFIVKIWKMMDKLYVCMVSKRSTTFMLLNKPTRSPLLPCK